MFPARYGIAIGGVVLGSVAFSVAMASRIPDPAPIHWNLRGEIDGYGPRWLALGLFPALTALFSGFLVLLGRSGAVAGSPERSMKPYARLSLGVAVLLASLGGLFQLAAAGTDLDVAAIVFLPVGLFFAFAGLSLRDVGRNHWMGIRTPWTLASDAVWDATHRAGSRVMAAVGLLTAASAFVLPMWGGLVLLVAGATSLVAWSFVYSRRVHADLEAGRAAGDTDTRNSR